VNERTMLRFLKLIACDNSKIGTYAKLVDDRNESAHPNGNIFFSTPGALDIKIREILRVVDEIQNHSASTIQRCYTRFLTDSGDPGERECADDTDQLQEVLIRGNYMSQKDIELCAACAITDFAKHPHYAGIESLHRSLRNTYLEPVDTSDARTSL
jgi:hypothetical protein